MSTPDPAVNIARPGRRPYRTAMTQAERAARARRAALSRWAAEPDRAAATSPARAARRAGYYAGADAAGITDPAVRDSMARAAELAEMARLQLLSLAAQRRRNAS